jgi:RHS repeat-associated protein
MACSATQEQYGPKSTTEMSERRRVSGSKRVARGFAIIILAMAAMAWSAAGNLVANGDFSQGNTGFGSSFTYSSSTLWPDTTYAVTGNPGSLHDPGNSMFDHTTGSGLMLAVNGTSISGRTTVWSQTVSVVSGRDYNFSMWVASWSSFTPGQLQVKINGSTVIDTFTLSTNQGAWIKIQGTWHSGASTFASIQIINPLILAGGNDFAIDDIVLNLSQNPNGLVAHYPFDGNANDASGNGRNARLHNDVTFVTGKIGQAIYITGSGHTGTNGGHATFPWPNLSSMSSWSISIWVRDSGCTSSGWDENYIGFRSLGCTVGDCTAVGIRSSGGCPPGAVNFGVLGGGGLNAGFSPSDIATWVHYTMVYSNGFLSAYKNGAKIGRVSSAPPPMFSGAGLGIHWFYDGGVSTRFIGAIDDVRIYSRALSDAEVISLSTGSTVSQPASVNESRDFDWFKTLVNAICGKSGKSSPVYTKSGNYQATIDDAVLPARGLPLQITRSYNSIENYDGPFSHGWCFNQTIQLIRSAASNGTEMAIVRWANGVRKDFVLSNGVYRAPVGCYDTLVSNAAGYELRMPSGMKMQFGPSGFLLSQTDPNSNSVTYAYNGQGRLGQVTSADGRTLTYQYGPNGRATNISDWVGRHWRYTYDSDDNLIRVTYPDGAAITYQFDTNHNMLAAIDPRSNVVVTISYTGSANRAASYSEGSAVNFGMSYFPQSNITIKTDQQGRQSRFAYNQHGNKTNWVNPANNALQIAWTANQQIHRTVDPRGNPQTFLYDNRGNVILASNALGHVTSSTYESNFNRVTSMTDPLGNVVSNQYDSRGNLVWTRDAQGYVRQFQYDAHGNMTNSIDARGNAVALTYDIHGNLLSVKDPLGNSTVYEYDAAGNRIRMADARGFVWSYGYDVMGRLLAVTNPLGQVTRYTYDANGNQTSIQDARSNLTRMAYDSYNRPAAMTNALGHATRIAYDIYGNTVSVRDPLGNVVSNTFDVLNQLVATRDPLGNVTRLGYDANGNQTVVTDALNRVTRMGYDPLNRRVALTNALGAVWRYQFDANGNLLAAIDANARTNRSAYDQRNMVTNSANALGFAYRYEYDGNGNVVKRADPNGAVLLYAYDAANRLTNIAYPDGGLLTFSYDPSGNATRISNATETVEYAYDALNRVTNVLVVGLARQVAYAYDAVGNRAVMTDPDGGKTLYTYDALNRLTALQDPQTNTWTFGYDAANRMTSMLMPNGIQCLYQYDTASRLTNMVYRNSTNTILQSFAYTYDAVGNPLRVRREDNLFENYAYDAVDQLVRVDYDASTAGGSSTNFTTYTYDPVGNRMVHSNGHGRVIYVYDAANRLLSVTSAASTVQYAWDRNGNLTNSLANGTNTAYAWDFENKLVTIRYQDGSSNIFGYYPSSSLRHTKVDSTGTNRYIYDGQNELQHLDGLGTLIAQYTHSLGIDSLLARSAGGGKQYYLRDMIGSVTAIADLGQNLVSTYRYDAFGAVRRLVGGGDNSYLFTSRMLDQDSGLYYYRARYLYAGGGSFISVDPMFASSFSYAKNAPARYGDPSGNIVQVLSHFMGGGTIGGFVQEHLGYARMVGGTLGAVGAGTSALVFLPAAAALGSLTGGIGDNVAGAYWTFPQEKMSESISLFGEGMNDVVSSRGYGRPFAGSSEAFGSYKPYSATLGNLSNGEDVGCVVNAVDTLWSLLFAGLKGYDKGLRNLGDKGETGYEMYWARMSGHGDTVQSLALRQFAAHGIESAGAQKLVSSMLKHMGAGKEYREIVEEIVGWGYSSQTQ